jgi:hypothetical protein
MAGRMFRCVLESGKHYTDDVTSIIMFDWKTGKSQVIAKMGFLVSKVLISRYFRIGGYSTGTENFRAERLDEYPGDGVNSRAFPARPAFPGTDPDGASLSGLLRM